MPSLKQLEEFQRLIGNIGGQNEWLAAEGRTPEKFRLPDDEPLPPPPAKEDVEEAAPTPAEESSRLEITPAPQDPAAEESARDDPPVIDFSDFGAFVDAQPPDTPELETPLPEIDQEPEEIPAPEETPVEEAPVEETTAEETTAEEAPAEEAPVEEAPLLDETSFNLDDFGMADEEPASDAPSADTSEPEIALPELDQTSPDTSAPEEAPAEEAPLLDESSFNIDDFGMADTEPPAEPPPDNLDTETDFNLDNFGFDDAAPADADTAADDFVPPPETGESDISFDDMDMSGLSGDTDLSDALSPAEETSGSEEVPELVEEVEDEEVPSITETEVSEEEKSVLLSGRKDRKENEERTEPAPSAGTSSEEDTSLDRFDAFDFNTDSKDADNTLPDLDDFNITGTTTASSKKGEAGEKKTEELQLTEAELEALLETLATYPLNVRVACEEIIAEQIVPASQLSALTKLLINGGSAAEAARLAGKIVGKKVPLPKGYKTGEALEEEQRSLPYIFFHKFFPVIRLFILIALVAASASYLIWHFVVNPLIAESLYKKGYELIALGDPNEYRRANQYFNNAFDKHRVKTWFYKYAQRFREEKQYLYAREKYDALLYYYPHDKQGALLYAEMEAYEQHNYEKADKLIRNEILDYRIDDKDGLLALGDVNLAWAEIDPSRYEDARAAYARLLTFYGYTDQVLERMLLYFIRTDKLFEVLPLQQRFMGNPKSKITAPTLAELGGYLLDKRLEVPDGVPDENIERIEGIKDILIRAEKAAPSLPEPNYHLARYYNFYGALIEERFTLEAAAAGFDTAQEETAKRTGYRIDTQQRLASLMTRNREFILAERELIKAANIYEDAVNRGLLSRKPQFGKLYADLGDLEYFAKEGALDTAARYYLQAESNGWLPPDIQYRLGNTYYRRGSYPAALNRFFNVSRNFPLNRRLLFALGNTSYQNADYFTAQAYYKMLLDLLNTEKGHISNVLPDSSPEHNELIERLMMAQNNMGVTLNALGTRTGRSEFRPQALVMFSDAIRDWDALKRDQTTMLRPSFLELRLPGASRPYLNMQHALYPTPDTEPQIFAGIDADVLEPSEWETLIGRSE